MGTINDLNTTDTLADEDKFVIWQNQSQATRAITAENMAEYFSLAGGPYQPLDEMLTSIAATGPTSTAGQMFYTTAQDTVVLGSYATIRGLLSAQPLDATLTAIAGLTITDGDYIQGTGTDTFRARKLTVANYAALTAIVAGSRFDDMLVYVASRATDGDGGDGWWRFDAASSATANGGTILAPDAGTGRWIRIYTGWVKAVWFGTSGASIVLALAAGDDVHVTAGTWAFADDTTIALGKRLHLDGGALLAPASTKTLTIRGELVDPPNRQIFSGAGVVRGLRLSRPVWFGAVADGVTPDQVAVQAAHDALGSQNTDQGEPLVLDLGIGNYAISSVVTFSPSQNFPLRVRGSGVTGSIGARFTVLASFSGSDRAILIDGQTGSTAPAADYALSDFSVVNGGSTSCERGIQFSVADKTLGGIELNLVSNVHVIGFLNCWRIQNTRLVKFSRCSAWHEGVASSRGFLITTPTNTVANFTGDLIFEGCQAVGLLADSSIGFSIENSSTNTGIAGVRFQSCTTYRHTNGAYIFVGAGAGVADVFYDDDCQFDGTGGRAIVMEANAGGTASYIDNVSIGAVYIQGMGGGGIAMQATNLGIIRDVRITGSRMNGITFAGIRAQGVQGLTVTGNILSDIGYVGQSAIQVISCRSVTVQGNVLKGRTSYASSVVSYFIGLDTVEDVIVNGNTGGGIPSVSVIADASGAARKAIANNV